MAAAPADFRPDRRGRGQAAAPGRPRRSELEPTEDILAGSLAAAARRADARRLRRRARRGRSPSAPARSSTRKGLDPIVLNDVSNPTIGFESPENAVTLISTPVPLGSKDAIADAILEKSLSSTGIDRS